MKKADLESMTVTELKALAKKSGMALKAGLAKAGIIKALSGSQGAAKKTVKAKPGAKTKAKTAKAASGKGMARKPAGRKNAAAKPAVSRKSEVKVKPTAVKHPAPAAPRREWQQPPDRDEQLRAQERIEDSKYFTGMREGRGPSTGGQLPHEYGEERITVLSRDPYTLFGYWEVPQERIDRERKMSGGDGKLCIRVYDVTGITFDGGNATSTFDQEVSDRVGSWYFNLARPSHCFCADIGLLTKDGRFRTIIRSNLVSMPRDGVSDLVDQSWTLADEEFMKLYGYPGGVPSGLSSAQLREVFSQRAKHDISSHGLFSRQGQAQKRK